MKHRITNIYNTTDAEEIKMATDAKDFTRTAIQTLGTLATTMLGTGLLVSGLENFSTIPFSFGMILASASSANLSFKLYNLHNIYQKIKAKKELELTKDNHLSENPNYESKNTKSEKDYDYLSNDIAFGGINR